MKEFFILKLVIDTFLYCSSEFFVKFCSKGANLEMIFKFLGPNYPKGEFWNYIVKLYVNKSCSIEKLAER